MDSSEDIYVELRLATLAPSPRADSVVDLLIQRGLSSEAQEAIYVVAVDYDHVRRVACVAKGAYHNVVVPIPAVLAVPLLSGSDQFVIAHNHTSGRLLPSTFDYDLTKKIVAAANTLGMTVTDHIIMAPDGRYFSFAESGALEVPEPPTLAGA